MHDFFMWRCLDLAGNGLGSAAPNPLVGAVIVHQGKIIGEGFHLKAGDPHAEVMAMNSVKDKSNLKESTLYVSLEPCSHQGRTPPCTGLITSLNIPEVVIGTADTSAKVNGKGIAILNSAGCNVITGVLEKECRFLNRRFFTFHEKKRPYVILKWAQTKDKFIDSCRDANQPPAWITNRLAKMMVHKWRSEEAGIMAGFNTLVRDNPQLTVRDWAGKNPLRLAYDRDRQLPAGLHIFNDQAPSLIFTNEKTGQPDSRYIELPDDRFYLEAIFDELYKREILSLFVEGGRQLHNDFLSSGLWDEARVFTGNMSFHNGIPAPVIGFSPVSEEMVDDSKLEIYLNK
ncbi:MAG: bifunctional diaminohydroxyphosphoribosylaminopyrimidine deaminase/5-amino-6-(5-phosphoribosylamino)uracil reductase RibD [Bacteroidia bacterium]|nr:bifunctional diaminohydroxyphosphoribosylaminopyrimidine deaminase/5-amino-6-(5-phosphoribosylamino)uracil reductase RibD [Bacteroidia bacterium]